MGLHLILFILCIILTVSHILQEMRVIKVKVKVNFTLEQSTKAQRGSRGIALLIP